MVSRTVPSWTSTCWLVTTVSRAFIIWSWTPSSVWGPVKQPQMVSTMRTMSSLLGSVESGTLPVRWPYAISFCRQSSDVTTILGDLLWQANSKGRKYFSAEITLESVLGCGKALETASSFGLLGYSLISFFKSSVKDKRLS